MKSVRVKTIFCNLKRVLMVLICGVVLQAASVGAAEPSAGAAVVDPVSLNASIERIDLRHGYFMVAEKVIMLEKAGSLARLMDLDGNPIRLESFKAGEYVRVTGGRFPDGKIYAFEIRKVRR